MWLGGVLASEELVRDGVPLKVGSDSPLFGAVHKMHTTATLNPYEREILDRVPLLIGRKGGKPIRGPLLTIPASITPGSSGGYTVEGNDDLMRFNALPFKAEDGPASLELAISRVLAVSVGGQRPPPSRISSSTSSGSSPRWSEAESSTAGSTVSRQNHRKETSFASSIKRPSSSHPSRTTSWRATWSSTADGVQEGESALLSLLEGAGAEESVESQSLTLNCKPLIFPFPSNRVSGR